MPRRNRREPEPARFHITGIGRPHTQAEPERQRQPGRHDGVGNPPQGVAPSPVGTADFVGCIAYEREIS